MNDTTRALIKQIKRHGMLILRNVWSSLFCPGHIVVNDLRRRELLVIKGKPPENTFQGTPGCGQAVDYEFTVKILAGEGKFGGGSDQRPIDIN